MSVASRPYGDPWKTRGPGCGARAAAVVTDAALRVHGVTHTEIRHDRANQISGCIPRRLGYQHVDTVARERDAPGESGTALHWRMAAEDHPDSVAARLAADETALPAHRPARP